MPNPLVQFNDRQQRLLYTDPKGSKLVMYSDELLGGTSQMKLLQPGKLTDSQRLARTDLLAIPGAEITSLDTGITYRSNGTNWIPSLMAGGGIGSPMIVAKSNQVFSRASANTSGDTSFATLSSFITPGVSLGPNGSLLIEVETQYTNSAFAKSLQMYVGSTAISPEVTLTNNTSNDNWRHFLHNTATNAQKYRASRAIQQGSTVGFVVTAIDTNFDFQVDIRCRWGSAVASETISLVSLRAIVEYGG